MILRFHKCVFATIGAIHFMNVGDNSSACLAFTPLYSSSFSSTSTSSSSSIAAFFPQQREQQYDHSSSSSTTPSIEPFTYPRSKTSLFAGAGGGNLFRPRRRDNPNDDDDENNKNDETNEEEQEEEEEEEEEEQTLYETFASSEFKTDDDQSPNTNTLATTSSSSSSTTSSGSTTTTAIDWGGEYETLRSRASDAKNNLVTPSRALFRTMTTQSPNEAVANFVNKASPQVIDAMSGTVQSLLGGLIGQPGGGGGVETLIKANGEKLGNLCFQLQMTGYMFRNAEYVLAIRDIMNLRGSTASYQDYKRAFDKLDNDQSGYIETNEIESLLMDVYGGDSIPQFEVNAFLKFFDSNEDGRISWNEFERGLGVVASGKMKQQQQQQQQQSGGVVGALPGSTTLDNEDDDDEYDNEDDEDESDIDLFANTSVSGKVKVELANGRVIEVEASEYIEELKKEAEVLKAALEQEETKLQKSLPPPPPPQEQQPTEDQQSYSSISGYIASLGGDLTSLTEGISPDVVDAMKQLIDYVLDGRGSQGRGGAAGEKQDRKDMEMEITGSALQQLALWQLVLGYKLREEEVTGEYRRMLE